MTTETKIANNIDKAKTEKEKWLSDIKAAARKLFPAADEINVAYTWHHGHGRDYHKGYEGSDVTLRIRPVKDKYDADKDFSDVELKAGKLTARVVRVTREEITVK